MFKVVPNLPFWWPVKVLEPDPEAPGKLIEQEFEAEFRLIEDDEAKQAAETRRQILAKVSPDLSDEQLKAVTEELEVHDRVSLQRVLIGWRKIEDQQGKPLAFSEAAFDAVYNMRRVRTAFTRAYLEAISEDKARLGN